MHVGLKQASLSTLAMRGLLGALSATAGVNDITHQRGRISE